MIREVILILLISNFLHGQIVLFYILVETHFYVQEEKKSRLKHFQKASLKRK